MSTCTIEAGEGMKSSVRATTAPWSVGSTGGLNLTASISRDVTQAHLRRLICRLMTRLLIAKLPQRRLSSQQTLAVNKVSKMQTWKG